MRGCAAELLLEAIRKILTGIETNCKGDVSDGHLRLVQEQVACVVETYAIELISRSGIKNMPTGCGEVTFSNAAGMRHFADTPCFGRFLAARFKAVKKLTDGLVKALRVVL